MSDTPGFPSAIGIEAVECVADASGGVTVRVTGRWPRRRPEWRGPAMLVIDVQGGRQRIPAMPEPPSLSGVLPGTWRMSFSVPPELAEYLEGRTWLALGAVMAPLALPHAERPERPRVPPDPALLEARERRSYVVAAERARRRALEAEERAAGLEATVERLQRALEEAHREPERLQGVIAARERELLLETQRTHAESARVQEVEHRLAIVEQALAASRGRARALAERLRELEAELRRAQRRADEARHEAAAARAAAGRVAGRGPAATRRPGPLAGEIALARGGQTGRAPRAPTSALPEPPRAALERERALTARGPFGHRPDDELRAEMATLRAELEAARLDLAREHEARLAADARAVSAEERAVSAEQSKASAQERAAALEGQLGRQREHTQRALDAVSEFRQELAHLREPAEPAAPAFEPDRLAAALERLREEHPAPEEAPEPEDGSVEPLESHPEGGSAEPRAAEGTWHRPDREPPDALPRLFRTLVAKDEPAAGRLVLALLPAQRLAYPRPVAYDLVLGPGAVVRVTVGSGAPSIELSATPRDPHEVQFRVDGEPPALARLLAAGRLRRRFGRRLARVRGERAAFAALERLVQTRLWPQQLDAVGVRLDPPLTLCLVALLIDRFLGPGEPFAIVHRAGADGSPSATLHVSAEGQATVSHLGLEVPGATTIVCPPDDLLAALLGRRGPGIELLGDEQPLRLVRHALERA